MLNDVVCYELNILHVLNTRTQFPKLILHHEMWFFQSKLLIDFALKFSRSHNACSLMTRLLADKNMIVIQFQLFRLAVLSSLNHFKCFI